MTGVDIHAPAIDPVCGTQLDPQTTTTTPTATYDVVTYRFCSVQCRETFTVDPRHDHHQPVGNQGF